MKKSVKTEPDEKYLADIEKMMKSWPATKGYVDKAIEAHEAAAHSEPETETGRKEVSMARKVLGFVILAAIFMALFVAMASDIGIMNAIMTIVIACLTVALIYFAAWLIVK